MNRRIFFAVLIGFAAGLLCISSKKHRRRSNRIAQTLKSQMYPTPENGYKWGIKWPVTNATETVLDKAVYRNGHIRNN